MYYWYMSTQASERKIDETTITVRIVAAAVRCSAILPIKIKESKVMLIVHILS